MTQLSDTYDALIVGGGPAGTSAAIHLAISGARVLLVEQKKFPREKLCGEFISPECLDIFARLGVAESMLRADGVRLTETVFYARNGNSVSIPSEWFGQARVSALGLSRAEMDARLLSRARQVGVEVREEVQATNLIIEDGRVCGVLLKKDGGDITSERALVTMDATGRTRALARRVEKSEQDNNRKRQKQTRLVAFKAHLNGAQGTPGHCEIYVYRGGYGGLNLVENGMSNLCFIALARDVRACGGDAQRVMREVVMRNRRAGWTLEQARNVSPWLAVALDSFGRLCLIPAAGLLAIGDAAAFIDPFTGSGMLMALESGELAALSVMRHLSRLGQPGMFDLLANDYCVHYSRKFASRLRVSAVLRRAAFIPRVAEAMIFTLGASERVRRQLARATRKTPDDLRMPVT